LFTDSSTISQIGTLTALTETGAPAEGVQWNLRSLGIRLEIGSPEVGIDLDRLVRQRELLGNRRFKQIVQEQLDEQSDQCGAGHARPLERRRIRLMSICG